MITDHDPTPLSTEAEGLRLVGLSREGADGHDSVCLRSFTNH